MATMHTATQKDLAISNLLKTKGGRAKLAATMQEPLRQLRDYESVGRRAFFIDPLPDGTLPIYDLDIDVPAYVIGEEADSIQQVVHSKRLLVPIYELASNPVVPFTQIKERRFDVVRRIKEKTKVELFRREDTIIFALMKKVGLVNTFNPPISIATASFTINTIIDAFAGVEKNGLRVDKIFMNPANYKVVRKAGRDYLDFETQRELLRTGYQGLLYGAQVFLSMQVPINNIMLVTDPEYFGVMPVRIDLTVLPADIPAERKLGWSVFQSNGLGIHNPRGLQLIVLT